MKKRFLAMLLCVCLIMGMMPVSAFAQEVEDETETVDYTLVLYEGKAYKDQAVADNLLSDMEAMGISYEVNEEGTIYTYSFSGVSFNTTAPVAMQILDAYPVIHLAEGTVNFIEGGDSDSEENTCGLYVSTNATGSATDLAITGSGSLNVTAGDTNGSHSIGIDVGNELSITDATIAATSGAAKTASAGINVVYSMDIENASVTGNGGVSDGKSYGIYVDSSTLTVGGSTVAGNGAEAEASYGINVGYSCTIDNSEVSASSATATSVSYGIYTYRNMSVAGSRVNAMGGNADEMSFGIYVGEYADFYSGEMIVSAGKAPCGIAVCSGYFSLEGGNFKATATESEEGYGLMIFDVTGANIYVGVPTDSTEPTEPTDSTEPTESTKPTVLVATGSTNAVGTMDTDGETMIPFALHTMAYDESRVAVYADTAFDGSNMVELTEWAGDGTDDVSEYKYMLFTDCEHTTDNACDSICNICEAKLTVPPHQYDNDCDETCNVCGEERTVADHVYDNACDETCNVCGEERTVADHVYDNACDAACNVCDAERTVADHVYDNACDAACNECGMERTPAQHIWNGGEVTLAATTQTEGVMTYTCTVCHATKTETIAKLAAEEKTEEVAEETQEVKKDDKVTDTKTKAVYKVTNAKKKTVEYTAPKNKKSKNITVPSSIKIDGETYKVTSVSAKAFYKCTSLKKVTIPSSVTEIGAKAFYGCKNLKTIVIKTTKLTSKKIGKDAFKGTPKTTTVTVPKSKLKAYKKLLVSKGINKNAKIKK